MDYRGLNIAYNKWYKKNKNSFISENIYRSMSCIIDIAEPKDKIEK